LDNDLTMGFNKRKMEDRRRQEAEKEAAARLGADVLVERSSEGAPAR
jgi:hypothetical protein